MIKEHRHYIDERLRGQHQIKIGVIGVGGTGSNILQQLARMNHCLLKLGHSGLMVTAYDNDTISEHNFGRSLFQENEIGRYKSEVLISKINAYYGYTWKAFTEQYNYTYKDILFVCVDSYEARKEIYGKSSNIYFIDCGNGNDYGQVILGTIHKIKQPESKYKTICTLKTFIDFYPTPSESKIDTPSCSLAHALAKQDLYINTIIATYACNMLWKFIRRLFLTYHAVFVNLEAVENKIINLNRYKK